MAQANVTLRLNWDSCPGVAWTVYRSLQIDDFGAAEVMAADLTVASWADADPGKGSPGCYWVTATSLSTGLESALSVPALGQLLPPQGMAVVTAQVSRSGEVWLDWTGGEVDLAAGWSLYSQGPSAAGFSCQEGFTKRSASLRIVEAGRWNFFVKAANAIGKGMASEILRVKLKRRAEDTSPMTFGSLRRHS